MQQGDYFSKNPNIEKIFIDLEEFREFCRYAYAYGYNGYVYNEKDLYDTKSRVWQSFCMYKKFGPRKWKPNYNKPWKKGFKSFRKNK
tara:strand:- start:299 stop:559 length:261 start_codon:yes stop_codon:yes gene_type:complete